jgi:hypothetical protein
MKTCCLHNMRSKSCVRKQDKKVFQLPRRFTRKRCVEGQVRGFTMRSSCAPYQFCKKNKKSKKTKTRANTCKRKK